MSIGQHSVARQGDRDKDECLDWFNQYHLSAGEKNLM